MARTDQRRVTAKVGGVNLGVFKTLSGFDADSEETSTREEAGAPVEQLGGPPLVANGTISRTYRAERDGLVLAMLRKVRGKPNAGEIIVTEQDLDGDYSPAGTRTVYRGVVKSVVRSDHDVEGNEVETITIEVSPHGDIATEATR